MSTRRRADIEAPLSYSKFMSAEEFTALRPIPANLVLPKALLYRDAKIRELAFFLQGMSMQPGGLMAVADRLVDLFPSKCREEESQRGFVLRLAESMAQAEAGEGVHDKATLPSRTKSLLGDYLAELILNPAISLSEINCPCFQDLGLALNKFKKIHEQQCVDGFVMTSAGTAINETLDQALQMSRMVVIEGNAGAGKSTNAKAWCSTKSGRVRSVSLTGITNRTTFFQKMASALGLATCQRKAQELQTKIEDFFARSRMMLVIDEAHYLWPQSPRADAPPELIDWIDTALVNQGVPVALLCTDQFSKLKNRVERRTGWTSDQFIHRVFRYRKLATKPTMADVEAVTRRLLSATWNSERLLWEASLHACDSVAVDALARYALERSIPFAIVSSCIDEARMRALKEGRVVVTRRDIQEAWSKGQAPSDEALLRSFEPAPAARRGRRTAAPVAPVTARSYAPVGSPDDSVPFENRAVRPGTKRPETLLKT